MNPTKLDLRRSLKQARLALSPEERQRRSTVIVERLWQAVDWSAAATIHCFEPIGRLGEVDVTDFIAALQDEYPAVRLFTSRQIDDEWQIVALKTGTPVAAPTEFDVIIVPMLGFDPASRQRIGYGGGYYDRFLAAQPQAYKVGVCFEVGRLGRLPAESHDVPLDVIVTEIHVHKK